MKTRKLNFTVKIEDNDIIQNNLEKLLYSVIGEEKVTDFRVLPNTDHLKDKQHFKKLLKDVKNSKNNLYKFINDNR